MIRIEGYAACSDDTGPRALLDVPGGAWAIILGRSGSGKTEFCLMAAGLLDDPPGNVSLDGIPLREIAPRRRAATIAYLPSDPALIFSGIKSTLSGEFGLAQRMVGQTHASDPMLVPSICDLFQLGPLLTRDPFTLSGGEAARAAIAISLVKRPRLLILDQMMDHLDPVAMIELRDAIDTLLPDDSAVIEATSRRADFEASGDLLTNTRLPALSGDKSASWEVSIRDRPTQRHAPSPVRTTDRVSPLLESCEGAEPQELLTIRGLRFRYPDSGFALGPIDLDVNVGERIALIGPNGAGKTTLLRCLAMLLRPQFDRFDVATAGEVATPPIDDRALHNWARHALYCFQRPEDQLYLPTVRQELVETSKRLGTQGGPARAMEIAEALGLDDFFERSPFDLPRAHRRLIPIAAAIAAASPLLLLDEPTVGLDDEQVARLASLLKNEGPASAVIMISHDLPFIEAAASRVVELSPPRSYQGEESKPARFPR